MKVSDAIDYIVNDSVALLRRPQPNESIVSFPRGTRIVVVRGTEHQDARTQLNTKLNTGEIKSWGDVK